MSEPKIGWRKLEGEHAWVGVRGRVKFFTLRLTARDPRAYDGVKIEYYELPYALTYHTVDGKQETLKLMRLADAQAHAERELDSWLVKAGLVEPEKPTPVQHALNSAMNIVDACREDGITSLSTDDGRVTLAARIALYSTVSTLTELAVIKGRTQDTEGHLAAEMEKSREELYEVMTDLKEII
jgi:hypothetical protein